MPNFLQFPLNLLYLFHLSRYLEIIFFLIAICNQNIPMDRLDKAILGVLQRNGKVPMQELAEATNSSTTQCWRRIKQMQDNGIITGFQAVVDAKAMGLDVTAYIHIALKDHNEEDVKAFLKMVDGCDQIIECCSILGDHDFVLKVVARSPDGLERFIRKELLTTGLIRETRSNFVLRQTKGNSPLPTQVV